MLRRAAPLLFLLPGLAAASLPEGYATLWLTRDAPPRVEQAAGELAGLLERTFGERPALRRLALFGNPRGLRIGPNPVHPAFDADPLTDEVVVERHAGGITIAGSDSTATCFAIYRFAEAFLGWRYFQPGELGLERLDNPPEPPAIKGPAAILLAERTPFYSRNLLGLNDQGRTPDWSAWQALRERFAYNHTLYKVLSPELFTEHPDWFAKDAAGTPMRPPYPQPHGYNDHPDLANPEVRQWVGDQTFTALLQATGKAPLPPGTRIFPPVKQSPDAVSTSLSLGDSFIFGSYPGHYPWSPIGYFRRWPDWSNHVFAYTNALAGGLTAEWEALPWRGKRPELYLGALSYLNWEDAPDFAVDPAIVPYLTYDRTQWYDAAVRADDLALVERWATRGPKFLGTWDYLFGYGFLIPRSMTRIVAESVPALSARGVRAYFSQMAAVWPYDGHTTWLLAKLLWNPQADAEALLDEYFREYYGPAAEPMRAFFDAAEALWMNQQGSGWWLRYWKDPWQAALWKGADQKAMRHNLDEALRLAAASPGEPDGAGLAADRFTRRIRQTVDLFEVTESFLRYQWYQWLLQWPNSKSYDRTYSILVGPQFFFPNLDKEREGLRDGIRRLVKENPLASYASDLEWVLRYDTADAALAAMTVVGMGEEHKNSQANPYRRMAKYHEFATLDKIENPEQVLYDTDFAHIGDPRIWNHQFLDSEGLAKHSGADGRGFVVRNARRGHVFQLFRAEAGHHYLGTVDLSTRQSPSGEIYIRIDFYDADNRLLAESRRARIAPAHMARGPDQRLRVVLEAPPGTSHGRLFIRFYEMDPGSEVELTTAQVLDLGSPPTP